MSGYDIDHEEPRAVVWDPALLRRMLGYAFRYRGRVAIGLLLVVVSSFLAVLPPLLVGALVDLVFGGEKSVVTRPVLDVLTAVVPGFTADSFAALGLEARLRVFAALFLFVRLATFFIDWGNGYLLAGLGQRVIADIRNQIFRHVHGLSLGWFHENPVGRLVTRVANDVGALEEMFSVAFVTIVKDVGMLVGIATVLLLLDARLGLVTLSVLPLMFFAAITFRRVSRAAYRRWRNALSRLNAFLAETLTGVRVVQLFGLERRSRHRHDVLSGEYRRHFLAQRRAWAVFRPVNTTLSAAAVGLVLWFGGAAALRGLGLDEEALAAVGGITAGTLISFLMFAEQFFAPIRDLTEKFDVIQGAMTAAERIFAVLDERSDIVSPPGAFAPDRLRGAVELRNVVFAYNPDEPVLRDVGLAVEPGRTVAIVGPTGAGKTTIINLLCRFYDADGGAVLVDGRDVREYDLTALRRNVGVVHQDVFLFAGSVLENLRLGDESKSREAVRGACRAVRADEFIERLPDGYDAVLTEGGRTLSTGQRQLLSFARALVFDPPILVLDEATASVDTHTEELIQAALRTLTEGRTSIVIAHRLSTIRRADRILVVAGGRITERGTHEELIERGGAYERLYRLQFSS